MSEVSKDKFILDATAGFRMMWFNKKHPNTIYLDCRSECEPDIVGDFRDLKQFPNETFRLIIFDPPHILEKGDNNDSNMKRCYGYLRPDVWRDDVKRGLKECFRVLKPYGILLFKWNTQQIASSEVMPLFPTQPLFYQISASYDARGKGSSHRQVKTLWFCFMKIPTENQKNE